MTAPVRHLAVRYTVKAERLEEHLALLGAVFARLAALRPSGLRYEAFRVAGQLDFLHVASLSTADGSNPLLALAEFQRFTAGIAERCVTPPQTSGLEQLGAQAG